MDTTSIYFAATLESQDCHFQVDSEIIRTGYLPSELVWHIQGILLVDFVALLPFET